METALREAHIECEIQSLPADGGAAKVGSERDSFLSSLTFLTEVSMMVEATYFVGTFNSNVATMATVLRGCPERGHDQEHYYHSYGVDSEIFIVE